MNLDFVALLFSAAERDWNAPELVPRVLDDLRQGHERREKRA